MSFALKLAGVSKTERMTRVDAAAEILGLTHLLDRLPHDQTEAMTMADRIVVLNAGHIEQVGTPEELYRDPDNLFVAGFIGTPEINTLKGMIQNGEIVLHNGYRFAYPLSPRAEGMEVICATRPHYLRISDSGIAAEIVLIEMTGEGQEIRVRVGDQELIVVSHEKLDVNAGQKVFLTVDAAKIFLFEAETGKRLRALRARQSPSATAEGAVDLITVFS
ncbi:TOBE domain-containing protein [Enterobacter wuhouensis]|uniref:TOBE domain-containing protein n=1 Tax=Enterobacter wuhouensis TaxID=2529381 RepID=UPI001F60D9F8|nr:TOBE domain-containing protein [Enterobacter wuhouensis]